MQNRIEVQLPDGVDPNVFQKTFQKFLEQVRNSNEDTPRLPIKGVYTNWCLECKCYLPGTGCCISVECVNEVAKGVTPSRFLQRRLK